MSEQAHARKARSEALLQQYGVPINTWLPIIEDQNEAQLRSQSAVIDRALALSVVIAKSEGVTPLRLATIIERYQLDGKFSVQEQAFLNDPAPTQKAIINARWRYEALWTLLWALSFIETWTYPNILCDPQATATTVIGHSATDFQQQAQLRSLPDILDAADFVYRCQWACVQARLDGHGDSVEGGLIGDVVYERLYALNWLIGMGETWDSVDTSS